MFIRRLLIVVSIAFFTLSLIDCSKESAPISSVNQTYSISCGIVTKIDDYPLYTLNYSSDYKFEEYLQTGEIPLYTSIHANVKNFSCPVSNNLKSIVNILPS